MSEKEQKMIKDQIIFKGKEYTVWNIHAIKINTKTFPEKTDKATPDFACLFYPLSNLFKLSIESLSTGKKMAAAEVMLTQEPEDAMATGASVKPSTQ